MQGGGAGAVQSAHTLGGGARGAVRVGHIVERSGRRVVCREWALAATRP